MLLGLRVRLQADKGRILEMFSQQNEKVELERPVEAKGGGASVVLAVTQGILPPSSMQT